MKRIVLLVSLLLAVAANAESPAGFDQRIQSEMAALMQQQSAAIASKTLEVADGIVGSNEEPEAATAQSAEKQNEIVSAEAENAATRAFLTSSRGVALRY